ncbi:MAG TPA: DUF4350 domain-containing protein [Gemmatimonadaceae bacterium]|nr:DUF4350 domain-containing protein [Gemmatimonadaceae bacterium]
MSRRPWTSAAILVGLLLVVLTAVIIAPSTEKGRSHSSLSAGVDGVRLARDLATRLGWEAETRTIAFSDTIRDPAPVQVLVDARVGAREAHALLDFVRAGGSLLVAGEAGALDDSLPLVSEAAGELVEGEGAGECPAADPWQAQLSRFTQFGSARWRRPAPEDTIGFGVVAVDSEMPPRRQERVGFGFPLGGGRIVAIADENYLVNDVVRRCELGAGVSFVRMIEYLTRGERGQRIAFDEYHHGYGVRGGSLTAIRMYLEGTRSGRMLAQMSVAGLLLLFAFAPRPLAPRDPSRVSRRSPLEHADALAHAYAGVGATRTATARLLAGVRRRSRRDRTRGRDTDEALLAAAAAASPEAATAAQVVARALESGVPDRDLPEVASAVHSIEHALTQRTNSPAR